MAESRSDSVEYEKRIRLVQEWLIDDVQVCDILAQIKKSFGVEERQGKRYIADARERWNEIEDDKLEQKRQKKILKLQKLVRSLKTEHQGTPAGIRAILAVEQEIIDLQGIRPAGKLEVSGPGGQPLAKQVIIVNGQEIEF